MTMVTASPSFSSSRRAVPTVRSDMPSWRPTDACEVVTPRPVRRSAHCASICATRSTVSAEIFTFPRSCSPRVDASLRRTSASHDVGDCQATIRLYAPSATGRDHDRDAGGSVAGADAPAAGGGAASGLRHRCTPATHGEARGGGEGDLRCVCAGRLRQVHSPSGAPDEPTRGGTPVNDWLSGEICLHFSCKLLADFVRRCSLIPALTATMRSPPLPPR